MGSKVVGPINVPLSNRNREEIDTFLEHRLGQTVLRGKGSRLVELLERALLLYREVQLKQMLEVSLTKQLSRLITTVYSLTKGAPVAEGYGRDPHLFRYKWNDEHQALRSAVQAKLAVRGDDDLERVDRVLRALDELYILLRPTALGKPPSINEAKPLVRAVCIFQQEIGQKVQYSWVVRRLPAPGASATRGGTREPLPSEAFEPSTRTSEIALCCNEAFRLGLSPQAIRSALKHYSIYIGPDGEPQLSDIDDLAC